MFRLGLLGLAPLAFITACAQPSGAPALPVGDPVPGPEIRSLVEGGPYALRIFDGDFAGTTGQLMWNFADATVSGSFTTADGESGTVSQSIAVNGDQLCAGEGDAQTCHFIYPYEDGFMEVTADGTVHAISTPL